jgi:hypothetical protein
MGLGLVLHGVSVFGGTRFWGSEWREQKARELMAAEENQSENSISGEVR